MRESSFQAEVIRDLKDIFPGCVILKNDPNYLQGFPDLLILYKNRWAALEVKPTYSAPHQPNQDYYVDTLDEMSFAAFIFPENKDAIFDELQHAFRSRRQARLSVRQ